MAAVVVQPIYSFGLRTGVTNNLCFSDEQTVIFPCGNNCVRYNFDQRWQKFIPGTEKSQSMQALAISANRRYLAVSESGEKATITVYDLQHEQGRKRKILNGGDISMQEFVCMAFSPDSKYLIGQAGGPEWMLILWLWEKQKVMATVVTSGSTNSVTQVSFNSYDNTQICVSGNGVFKLFRYSEGDLKQGSSPRVDSVNVLCHTWITEEQVIAGTDTGRLLVFESGDLRREIDIDTKPVLQDSDRKVNGKKREEMQAEETTEVIMMEGGWSAPRITAILSYSMGFACSVGPGIVSLFGKTEKKDSYRKTKEIRIPQDPCSIKPSHAEHQEITTICISPSEETLAVSTDRGQLYSVTLSSTETSKDEQAHFEFLSCSFHSKPITGLSICIRKPLIATSSRDHSVRIWNFETNVLELYKEFQEEAYSVALHPSGLFILVGFSDKLRLMNLLIDDIRTFKEFPVRSCQECSFSHGGHMFAAVNRNIIHIYSVITFKNILNLKGHNGKVQAIAWTLDDSRLVSCGMDGAVYEWNTLSSKRESESILKSCSYTGVAISSDTRSIFTVGTDHTLKEIKECQILREVSSDDVAYTSIAMSRCGRVIFTGTSSGTIRAIKYPLSIHRDWIECPSHCGPVTKMVITYDNQFLVTASEDSSLLVWRIVDKESRGFQRDKEIVYSKEILITKSDLEEMNQNMLELKTQVEDLKMENKYQLRLKDTNYSEKIKDLSEKFNQQLESFKTKSQAMKTEKEKQERLHLEAISKVVEEHSKELQDLESSNSQKHMLEFRKNQNLQDKCQRMQEYYEKQLTSAEESKSHALEEHTNCYEAKLQEKIHLLGKHQDEARQQMQEFDEMSRQIKEVYDQEINDLQVNYEKKLQAERANNGSLREETGIMKKKFESLQREIDDKCAEIEKLKQEQQKLPGVINSLEKEINGLKRVISERDETIQDKEMRVYNLKRKRQQLEKLRFVLDYKTTDMKKQIEQREDDIKQMKEIIQQMEMELNQFHQKTTLLELTVSDLKLKLESTDKQKHKAMQRVKDLETYVCSFEAALHSTKAFLQEPKKLKKSLRKLYDCFIPPGNVVEMVGVDPDVLKEHLRHHQHLERKLTSLEMNMHKDSEFLPQNHVKIMKENVSLIKEIDKLRKELHMAKAEIHSYETHTAKAKRPKKHSSSDLNVATVESLGDSGENRVVRLNFEEEAERIIQLQRLEIQRLRQESVSKDLVTMHSSSSTKLPALNT
ncbi:cilia- and flagella-associated protein 57-like [Lampris incognitus]|uniref:cilia- and flagella-associated protein 57-like n=1 Tax=Lampris incognitus TaxID=2546036 RepID=UPI0024B53B18|nr:cilia- and flagella-associated protein 57-like [Lampris incognitus]